MGMFFHAKCPNCWDPLPCDCPDEAGSASSPKIAEDVIARAVAKGVQIGIERARGDQQSKEGESR